MPFFCLTCVFYLTSLYGAGGYKIKYPSYYVLVTDLDHTSVPKPVIDQAKQPNQLPGDPTCDNTGCPPVPSTTGAISPLHTHSAFSSSSHPLMQPEYLKDAGRGLGVSRGLGERVWQDVIQCHQLTQSEGGASGGNSSNNNEGALTPAELGHWDFADPANRLSCTCAKCGSSSGGSSGGPLYKGGSGVATPGSVPSVRANGGGGSGGLADGPPASVESQASITPSPLPTPHSHPPSVTPHHGKQCNINNNNKSLFNKNKIDILKRIQLYCYCWIQILLFFQLINQCSVCEKSWLVHHLSTMQLVKCTRWDASAI